MKRRAVLAGAGGGLSSIVGGCLRETSGTEPDGDDPETYELVQFGAPIGAPDWAGHDEPSGHVELYGSTDAAFAGLAFEDVDEERRDSVETFVEETEFGEEPLLYIASVGPTTAYAEIAVEELEIDAGVVTGTARATAPENSAGGGAHTYPSALVRVTGASERPERAELTVVDGWDDEIELVAEIRL